MVFTALGAGASTLSGALLSNRQLLSRVGGVVIIVMGLLLAGVVRVPLLQREYRFDLSRVRPGPAGAMPLGNGVRHRLGACVGPVLAGILTLAASTTSGMRGAALLAVYSLGLAVPSSVSPSRPPACVRLSAGSSATRAAWSWRVAP